MACPVSAAPCRLGSCLGYKVTLKTELLLVSLSSLSLYTAGTSLLTKSLIRLKPFRSLHSTYDTQILCF